VALADVRDPITADIVIIGGGLEGLAIAWALAERGVQRIVVLERETIGSGGTGKSSGIVRCHYGVPDLAAMALVGNQLFEHAHEVLGTDVGFAKVGYGVVVAENNVGPLRANVEMQQGLGVNVCLETPGAFGELWPEANFDDVVAVAYEPDGGFADAYRLAMAFAAAAREKGVIVRQGVAALGLLTSADGSRVTGVATAAGPIQADHVVVAAGPWSGPLLAAIGVELPVRAERAQIVMVHHDVANDGERPRRPVISDLALLQYVRPELTGELLIGNSDHSKPEWADPDDYENAADWDHVERAVAKVEARFPGLRNPRIGQTYSGCYDVTPDYNPVIDHRVLDGLVICAGFSGHGFKISPAVGQLVADLVLDGASRHPHIDGDVFRLSRFADGDELVSLHPYAGAGEMR
jgi:sarcosine oxidase subunit beta